MDIFLQIENIIIVLQLWGGLFYLLNKIFLSHAATFPDLSRTVEISLQQLIKSCPPYVPLPNLAYLIKSR